MVNNPNSIEKKLAQLASGAHNAPAVDIRKKIDQHDRNNKSLTLLGLGFFQVLLAFFAPIVRLVREKPLSKTQKLETKDERKF